MTSEVIVELEDGLIVLVIGFSTVFVFLTIMIFAMEIMAKVIKYLNKIFPELVVETVAPKQMKTSSDEEIAVAVACSVLKQNHG